MSDAARAESLLALKAEYLIPCVYHFYKRPPVIVAGDGVWLIGMDGRRYLDCYSGVTVMSAGHSHPAILEVVRHQLDRLQHTTTIYLTEPMYHLAERIAAIAPGPLKRTFFCASGTEANEAAMLLASLATGRQGFVALTHALHGRTKWAMSVTGLPMWRTDAHLLENVRFAPHAFCECCPLDRHFPECGYACAGQLEACILDLGPERVAAVIAEPIQGNGGIIVPPDGYWQRIREICDRHRVLLIFDEIQTAMNRTGRWFASEHWETIPDIVTMAKALGNGMPIAAVVTNDSVAAAYTRPGASTFGANPVSCAAALAVLDVHEREQLGRRAAETGEWLTAELERIARETPYLARVRGKGLMVGVDVVNENGDADPARCDGLLEALKDRGFLLGKTGGERNTLTLMPPLIIGKTDLERLLDALTEISVPR